MKNAPWLDDALAPNGLSVRANFAAWFGRSRVVDGAGDPRVVFHGTRNDFDQFDPALGELGSHFSVSHDTAAGFADREGGRVMPVFLRIVSPVRLLDFGAWDAYEVVDALMAQRAIDGAQHRRLRVSIDDGAYDSDWALWEALESHGHDGIVYENTAEGGGDAYQDPATVLLPSALAA